MRTISQKRRQYGNLSRYDIQIEGTDNTFVEWFKDDAAAEQGIRDIMLLQGLPVDTVKIGFPTTFVTLKK